MPFIERKQRPKNGGSEAGEAGFAVSLVVDHRLRCACPVLATSKA